MVDVKEANIIINGVELTFSQSMTVRVALNSLVLTLKAEGLGRDELGQAICKNYLRNSAEVLKLIHKDIT